VKAVNNALKPWLNCGFLWTLKRNVSQEMCRRKKTELIWFRAQWCRGKTWKTYFTRVRQGFPRHTVNNLTLTGATARAVVDTPPPTKILIEQRGFFLFFSHWQKIAYSHAIIWRKGQFSHCIFDYCVKYVDVGINTFLKLFNTLFLFVFFMLCIIIN